MIKIIIYKHEKLLGYISFMFEKNLRILQLLILCERGIGYYSYFFSAFEYDMLKIFAFLSDITNSYSKFLMKLE